MNKALTLVAVGAMLGVASNAMAAFVIIDNFNQGPAGPITRGPVGLTGTQTQGPLAPADTLGAFRDFEGEVTATPGGGAQMALQVDTAAPGVFRHSQDTQLGAWSVLVWDGVNTATPTGASLLPRNVATTGLGGQDLTVMGANQIEIEIVQSDAAADLVMTVWTGPGGVPSSSTVTTAGGLSSGDTINFPFAGFAGADFSDVGAIQLVINDTRIEAFDITINEIRTGIAPGPGNEVPEPMTAGLALIGGVVLAARRRR